MQGPYMQEWKMPAQDWEMDDWELGENFSATNIAVQNSTILELRRKWNWLRNKIDEMTIVLPNNC